ncbi:MAG: hypothetical protein ACO2ZM_08095 [Francisellaceae bacterium]
MPRNIPRRPDFNTQAKNDHLEKVKELTQKGIKQPFDNCHRISYHQIKECVLEWSDNQLSESDFFNFCDLILADNKIADKPGLVNLVNIYKNNTSDKNLGKIISYLNSAIGNLNPGNRGVNRGIGARFDPKIEAINIKKNDAHFTPNSKKVLQGYSQLKRNLELACTPQKKRFKSSRTAYEDGHLGKPIDPNQLTPESKALLNSHLIHNLKSRGQIKHSPLSISQRNHGDTLHHSSKPVIDKNLFYAQSLHKSNSSFSDSLDESKSNAVSEPVSSNNDEPQINDLKIINQPLKLFLNLNDAFDSVCDKKSLSSTSP